MKLIRIFVSDDSYDGLWSVIMEKQNESEFDKFFDTVNDVEWLYHFFENNKADLASGFFGNVSIKDAVLRTLDEIGEAEDVLYEYAEKAFSDKGISLQHLFKPLNNFEYAIATRQKSKARIKKGWLRIYAVRLGPNCYIVTGCAIKLTKDMKREHLQQELMKLERVKEFLRSNDIEYPENLNTNQDD